MASYYDRFIYNSPDKRNQMQEREQKEWTEKAHATYIKLSKRPDAVKAVAK